MVVKNIKENIGGILGRIFFKRWTEKRPKKIKLGASIKRIGFIILEKREEIIKRVKKQKRKTKGKKRLFFFDFRKTNTPIRPRMATGPKERRYSTIWTL